MIEYLRNKHKKLILEEYIINKISDYRSDIGSEIINVDIHTLIDNNRTTIILVYYNKIKDITGNPIKNYSSKMINLYLDNDELICRRDNSTQGKELDMINSILKSFSRERILK